MTPVHHLMISVLGINRPSTISELSRTFYHSGCNLLNSKINVLGQDLAAFFFLSGNWGAIAKMEAALPGLKKRLNLNIQTVRSQDSASSDPQMTYNLQIIAIDRSGILNEISNFLNGSEVSVEEVCVHTYRTHTNTRMVSLQFRLNVPAHIHFATLREKIMNYCDDHNFDGFIEPLRH